jgi:ligand-binding sensor domain-containing protein/signal transduction histidine kinase
LNIRSPFRAAVLLALSLGGFVRAQTNETGLDQYKRAEWNLDQGLSSGRIQALAQTRDGYLWIGTAEGLLRFDGIRFVPILTKDKQPLPRVLGLTVDKGGTLWVRAADTHVREVHQDNISGPVATGVRLLGIVAMAPASPAGIYATETRKTVLRLTHNHVEQLPIYSEPLMVSIAEGTDKKLWVGTDRGLMSWTGGAPVAVSNPVVDQKINCLLADQGGRMWIGTDDGLAYWDGHRLIPRPFSRPDMRNLQVLTMMQDRDANLWIGTSSGLLRANSSGAEWVSTGPNSDRVPVTAVLQDREGDIWFGSGSTLERLESTPIVPLRHSESPNNGSFGPLYVDRRGRVWFTDGQQGLFWMNDGVVHTVRNDGLAKDEVYSIDGYGDDIWLGRRSGGLTRLHFGNGSVESKTWTTRDGLSQNSIYAVRVGSNGTVWAGTLTAGLNRFDNGRFSHIDEKNGLPADDISAIEFGDEGQVWIGTSGGVCKIESKRCLPISPDQHHGAKDVLALLADSAHGLWIGTSHGLLLANNHGQHPVSLGTGSQPRVLGLGLDNAGRLWIVCDRAVMSATPAELMESNNTSIRSYGNDDGLQSTKGVHRSRSLATDSYGQVWISTAHELAMVGTKPTPLPTVIPQVEEVSADGALLDRNNAKVSPGAKRVTFSFTGLDLHAPSRVRFRYRLDDFDKTWSDVGSDREATYTNLSPGKYTFRLIASNESNSWSSDESILPVFIEPGIWQRWSVRTFLAMLVIFLVGFAYYSRTKFLLTQANILADERLRERTRIARDVHDTLLQGFISSSMHLHVAEKQVAGDSPLKQRFASVLEGMDRVIEEARLAVVGLRTPESGRGGIENGLRDFFLEIADMGEAHLSLHQTGKPRRLKHEALEQTCSIAKEAILNAVRHSSARNIQVTIGWGWLHFKVSVSDDGSGIDAFTLEHGRALHWGLVGMRERAKQLKGELRITSSPNAGTTVSLSIPASIAYRRPRDSTDSADRT